MITAKKFLEDKQEEYFKELSVYADTNSKIAEWMIEFTFTHVTEALRIAYLNHEIDTIYYYDEDICKLSENSILNAYSLDNIK